MYMRDKLSLHEIAKRTGLSRNTIRKWLKVPAEKAPVYERQKKDSKLSAFHAVVE
jgi:transposase